MHIRGFFCLFRHSSFRRQPGFVIRHSDGIIVANAVPYLMSR
jgi:hypothetical protein